jgi:hypothetical protein
MVQTDSWASIQWAARQKDYQRFGYSFHCGTNGATGVIVHGHDPGCPGERKGIAQGQVFEIAKGSLPSNVPTCEAVSPSIIKRSDLGWLIGSQAKSGLGAPRENSEEPNFLTCQVPGLLRESFFLSLKN